MYTPAFEGKANELARIGAAEGLAVNIFVRPTICTLDEKSAAFSALMGTFMASNFVPPTCTADVTPDPNTESFEEARKKYEAQQAHDCMCTNGPCACRSVAFGSDVPDGEPKFGEPMGFGIGA